MLQLTLVVRARMLGWPPLVGFVLWLLFTAAQEPRMLRSFGVDLIPQAAWAAAVFPLVALCVLARSSSARHGAWANAATLLILGATQAGMAAGADAMFGPVKWIQHAQSCFGFCACWAPLSLLLAVGPRVDQPAQRAAEYVLVAAVVVLGIGLSASFWTTGWGANESLASLSGAAAAIARMSNERK